MGVIRNSGTLEPGWMSRIPDIGQRVSTSPAATAIPAQETGASGFDPPATANKVQLNPAQSPDGDRRAQVEGLKLSPEERSKLDDLLQGKSGAQARADVQKLLDTTRGSSADAVTAVVRHVLEVPGDASHAANIVGSPTFAKMSPRQKAQLLQLMSKGDPKDSQYLANLDKLAQSGALLDTDKDGGALLANLEQLSTEKLNRALASDGTTQAQLLSTVVSDCANPGAISQGDRETCSVASMQAAMAQRNPSEYARLIAGLSSFSGTVVLKGRDAQGNDTLSLQTGDSGRNDGRSVTDAMFQNAAMALGARTDFESYDAGRDSLDSKLPAMAPASSKKHLGLTAKEESGVASALFGAGYQSWTVKDAADGARQAKWLESYHGKDPAIVNVRLDGGGQHAMQFDHAADGKLYFRNPWGTNGKVPSPFGAGPNGTVSISEEAYAKGVGVSIAAPPSEGASGTDAPAAHAHSIVNPFEPDDDPGNGQDGVSGRDPGGNTYLGR